MLFESKTYRVEALIEAGFLEIGDGYRAKNSELCTHGLPFARVANINGGFLFADVDRFPLENLHRVGNKTSRPGDVVFTSKGTVGRFAYVTSHVEEFVYSPQLCFWRSLNPDVLDSRFLYLWMQGPEFMNQVENLKGQTDMADYVSLQDQRKMKITVPPLRVQLEIAATLEPLHDRVLLLQETSTTLESIAQSIFKSWFIDFDPVRAKAEGREPEGMDAETAALFPSEFEDSEPGMIPKGWKPGTLMDFAVLNPESWSAKLHPESLVYIDLANAKENRIDQAVEYSYRDAPSRARRVLRDGDTIVGTVRPGNRSYAFIAAAPEGLTGSTGFAVLRPKSDVFAEYVYLAATRTENIERLANLADGGAYPAVSPELVQRTPTIVPMLPIIGAFSEILKPLFQRQAANRKQEHTLSAIRDTLLPRLISGKPRVPEAQDAAEEALA